MVDTLKGRTADNVLIDLAAEKVGTTYYDHPGEPITGETMPAGGVSLLGWLTSQLPILRAIRDTLPVQYTEGNTDTTITGNAMMFEGDTGTSTLQTVSATHPLPVQDAALGEGVDIAMGPGITITTVALAVSTLATLVTPASGKILRVYAVTFSHGDATPTTISVRRSGNTTAYFTERLVGDGQPGGRAIKPTYWELAVNEVLQVIQSGAGTVYVTALTREV